MAFVFLAADRDQTTSFATNSPSCKVLWNKRMEKAHLDWPVINGEKAKKKNNTFSGFPPPSKDAQVPCFWGENK